MVKIPPCTGVSNQNHRGTGNGTGQTCCTTRYTTRCFYPHFFFFFWGRQQQWFSLCLGAVLNISISISLRRSLRHRHFFYAMEGENYRTLMTLKICYLVLPKSIAWQGPWYKTCLSNCVSESWQHLALVKPLSAGAHQPLTATAWNLSTRTAENTHPLHSKQIRPFCWPDYLSLLENVSWKTETVKC